MKRPFSAIPFFALFVVIGLSLIAIPTSAKPVESPGGKVLLVPTPTSFAQPYRLDIVYQNGSTPVYHFIFGKTYLWTMFPNDAWNDKEIKWYSVSGVRNEVIQGMLNWNTYKPIGVENTEEASSINTADVKFFNSNCPGLPQASTLGCFQPSIWDAGFMSTFNIRVWTKADVFIRPVCCGQTYGVNTKLAIVNHEIGHVLASLNDQAIPINGVSTCNGVVTSMEDGFAPDTNGIMQHCDGLASPNLADRDMWYDYMNRGQYNHSSTSVYGDGRLETKWVDRAWNDYHMQALWYWSNNSNGPWTYFIETNPIGNNGSSFYVPGAESRRLVADIYANGYGIHNKYIRVCVRPVFNYTQPPSNMGTQFCSPSVWYPY